jgi:hypothetical protein
MPSGPLPIPFEIDRPVEPATSQVPRTIKCMTIRKSKFLNKLFSVEFENRWL